RPAIQPLEIEIAAVHHVERTRLGRKRVQDIHVVHLRRRDAKKAGDGAAQIEQRVQLEGVLGRLVMGPGEQRQAEIDGGGVQGVDRVRQVQSQILVAIEPARFLDQDGGEIGIDPPIAAFVGVGQGAARDRTLNAHVIEPPVLRTQAGDDVAQTLAEGQLRKRHAQKLVPARETPHPVVAAIALYTLAKLVTRKMIHHLREQRSYQVHTYGYSNRSPPFAHLSFDLPSIYNRAPKP